MTEPIRSLLGAGDGIQPASLPALLTANPPSHHYLIAMHLIGVHCNSAAVHNHWAANAQDHWAEHTGPGGIRNHDPDYLGYDPEKVEAVLEEAEGNECDPVWEPGHAPAFPKIFHGSPEGRIRHILAVQLTEDNGLSVQEWLGKYGIISGWTRVPPRLNYGGRFGIFCSPPGYWVAIHPVGNQPEGFSPEEWNETWHRGMGYGLPAGARHK